MSRAKSKVTREIATAAIAAPTPDVQVPDPSAAPTPWSMIVEPDAGTTSPTKLDILIKALKAPQGASIGELAEATGWQSHSVRGAMAGSLKKKGHVITSERIDGLRRYRITVAS